MTIRIGFVRAVLFGMCIAATGCASRSASPAASPAAASRPNDAVVLRDTHERLQGVLWMQTAAEYWALASAAYRTASDNLDAAMKDKTWTAATEQKSGYETLPHAVILDLDETVLDNSPFQAQLVIDRTDFLGATWDAWVDTMAARIIPGAKEFIDSAERKGVKVFYVTNRTAEEQTETLTNLKNAGISADDATVLCTGENKWTSDKTARRAEVAKTHRILLLIGDDMNDFISTAKLTPMERKTLAMSHTDRWGKSWVLIPNALYGSWDRALYPGLTEDAAILKKKRDEVKGFK